MGEEEDRGRVIVIGGPVFGLVGPAFAARWEVPARHFSDPTWEEAKRGLVEMPSAGGPPQSGLVGVTFF